MNPAETVNVKAIDRVPSDDALDEFCAKLRRVTDIWLRAYLADPMPVPQEYTAEVEYEIRRRARGGHREVEQKELLFGMERRK